jgi:hypothetical protein
VPTAVIESLENRTLLSATPGLTPGITRSPADLDTLIGVFGVVNGKRTTLKVSLGSSRTATFALTGGAATALQGANGIHLEITSGATLTVTASRGATVAFSDINITGRLAKIMAPAGQIVGTLTAASSVGDVTIGAISGSATFAAGVTKFIGGDVAGTLSAGGSAASVKLGNVSGNVNVAGNVRALTAKAVSGTIYSIGALSSVKVGSVAGRIISASAITSLSATSLSGATVLAGANLGTDGLLGGAGSAADTFAAGTIGTLSISGAVSSSFIGAGANPFDGIFGNGNDTSAGTGLIKSISARSVDATTRFEAAAFGVAKLPKKVVVTIDPRFIVL